MTDAPRQTISAAAAPSEVLLRGLAILEALNRRVVSSVENLAEETRLPKPTIVRMLTLLASKGYAIRLPNRRGYMIGERAPALSSGYRSHDSIVEIARPFLARFTAQHKWPVALATFETDAMRLRVSSMQDSPFATAVDRSREARRVPMLRSALGLAYLAFCPAEERETILAVLRATGRDVDLKAGEPRYVDGLLAGIRRQGYALGPPEDGEPAIGLAAPVRVDRDVVATVTLRYFGKAISNREVVRRYLAPLRELAGTIARAQSRRIRDRNDPPPA